MRFLGSTAFKIERAASTRLLVLKNIAMAILRSLKSFVAEVGRDYAT